VNSNLAVMVANKEDLVRGQTSDGSTAVMTSTRRSTPIAPPPSGKGGAVVRRSTPPPQRRATDGATCPDGKRKPRLFAAFLCDDAALDVARAVAADMGWPPEKCARGGLRNAVQSLSISASPAILMVDLSESGDPLNDINALAEVCEPGTVVIAVGQVNDVRLYRDLIASGIQDYLLKPLAVGQVRDALARPRRSSTRPRPRRRATRQPCHHCRGRHARRVGASTLATSLAWAFSTDHKRSTALLDLDVHFGTGALTLDLEPGRGLTDAIDNPSRIDGLFIERAMIRANDNLAILSAEAPINAPLMTDGSAFMQLQEEFRQAFEMTVIDLPRNMLINFPHLLADVNAVVLTTELTLASARDAIRLLAWLKANAPCPCPRRGQQGAAGRGRDQPRRLRILDRAQARLCHPL
jgi:pilus assembly protein CpaE